MKVAIVLCLVAVLALTEARYMSSCDAPCDVKLYGEFAQCMSDGNVICGYCAAKKASCDDPSVHVVLNADEKVRLCGADWASKC